MSLRVDVLHCDLFFVAVELVVALLQAEINPSLALRLGLWKASELVKKVAKLNWWWDECCCRQHASEDAVFCTAGAAVRLVLVSCNDA